MAKLIVKTEHNLDRSIGSLSGFEAILLYHSCLSGWFWWNIGRQKYTHFHRIRVVVDDRANPHRHHCPSYSKRVCHCMGIMANERGLCASNTHPLLVQHCNSHMKLGFTTMPMPSRTAVRTAHFNFMEQKLLLLNCIWNMQCENKTISRAWEHEKKNLRLHTDGDRQQ